jgi:aminoglycoside phosphotransferase (APT) family kinase protein
MERVDGEVAPDLPPYTFGGWLHEAAPEVRRHVGESFVEALAAVHRVDARTADLAALELDVPGDTPLQRHVHHQRRYYDWIRGERRFTVIEDVFEWLADRWPADEGPAGLVWGDARLANALFLDGRLVALLDWEAAAVGPAELDLGWTLYFRDYFQRIAEQHGQPGLPDLLPPGEVVARHTELTGRPPSDLTWHLAYAALRQALTSIRVSERAVARGQMPEPPDHQGHILDRRHLEDILDGAAPTTPS